MLPASRNAASSEPGVRTAFLLHWFPKPSETFILDEVSTLHRQGMPLSVITLYGPHRGVSPRAGGDEAGIEVRRMGTRALAQVGRDIAYWLRNNGTAARQLWGSVPWRRWPDLESAGENAWAFLCGFHIGRLARDEGIGHLHAYWANGPATAARVASRLTGIPFSFTAWAGDIFPPEGALAGKIRDCVFVRSTSETFAGHLRKHAGPHADRIRVIHNGQDATRFVPARVLERPGPRLLAMGRFVPKKGFGHALEAAALLKEEHADLQLTVAGAGPEARRLRRQADSLGVSDRVRFPGWVPRAEAASFFRQSDIFLLPSVVDPAGDRDGIPNVVMEALLNGLPVVASDVGAVREIIRDGDTGRLVPPGDAVALAAAVRDLARHPGDARAMAERGRHLVLREFDLETNCRRFRDLLARPAGGVHE
jgi:glycosyltransferase involved in cell wall biosynthesis